MRERAKKTQAYLISKLAFARAAKMAVQVQG
jgi:hypothetical protein